MVNNQKENPMKSIKSQVFIGVLEDYSDFCISLLLPTMG